MRRKRPFNRAERIGGLMRDEVARIVQFELRDAVCRHVIVTGTRLSGDLAHLKVTWVMEDGLESDTAKTALERSAGYVGRTLRDTFDLRRNPKVVFYYDREHARMDRIQALLAADKAAQAGKTKTGNDG